MEVGAVLGAAEGSLLGSPRGPALAELVGWISGGQIGSEFPTVWAATAVTIMAPTTASAGTPMSQLRNVFLRGSVGEASSRSEVIAHFLAAHS